MEDPTIFRKKDNVEVELKSPTKAIICNTKTGNKAAITDKTDIDIISYLISENEIIVENVARDLGIDKHRVMKPLKKFAKREFLKDISEECTLLD